MRKIVAIIGDAIIELDSENINLRLRQAKLL